MERIKHYILGAFNQVFFTLFFTLFFIASIILFVKIAGLTSVVKMSFYELFLLYLYSLPMVLFYTIPVSFFVAGVLALNRLSSDSELIVLFSIGVSPSVVLKIFSKVATLVTLLLFLISLGAVPLSKLLYANFISKLQKEASLNIRASEFGHKFGDFFVFINESKDGRFEDVVMYSKKGFGDESFISAKEAILERGSEKIGIWLKSGQGFVEKNETIYQVNFESLKIYDTQALEEKPYGGVFEYWSWAFNGDKKRAKDLSASVMTSLFPLLILHAILFLGIRHHRSQKSRSYYYMIFICTLFYALTYSVSIASPFFGSVALLFLWSISVYGVYLLAIKRRY